MEPCPECAPRPYLCFEHNEAQRTREEGDLTVALFAGFWARRLEREQLFVARLASDARWWGWRVAMGQMLLAKAKDLIDARIRVVDDSLPIRAPMVAYEIGSEIAAQAFQAGFDSARRGR